MITFAEPTTQAAAAVPPTMPPMVVSTVEPSDGYRKVLLARFRRAAERARSLR
jgi:hypothetical protein